MAVDQEHLTSKIEEDVANVLDKALRTPVPPAFYNDEDPPEPPEDDPHWREFPFFNNIRSSHLLVVGIVASLMFATLVHLLILLAPLS